MSYQPPGEVLIVGAGMVGLSCAWSLQEHGITVTVADRLREGAGASWGNAGYVAPAMTVPLPEPSILRYGLRAVASPDSPVRLLLQADPALARFMAGLVRHCTSRAWQRAMHCYLPLNERIFESYERQQAGGVGCALARGDVLACFEDPDQAAGLMHELERVVGAGQPVSLELLTGTQAREQEQHLTGRVRMAVRVLGQRHLDPPKYVAALADSVRAREGKILEQTAVTSVARRGARVVAQTSAGDIEADAVVLANGAWLSSLAAGHGVRIPVYAGRGYSFSLPCPEPLASPLYFPATRVAVTPLGEHVRLAGIMEFGSPDAPLRPERIASVARSMRPYLQGVEWDGRSSDWVGPRPLSTDGLPVVGQSRTPGVYVAGGHGMWGVTLGPLTGHLLAGLIATGVTPAELRALDPCR